jgi:hypothetical protein
MGFVESLLFMIFRPDFGLELPGRQQVWAPEMSPPPPMPEIADPMPEISPPMPVHVL